MRVSLAQALVLGVLSACCTARADLGLNGRCSYWLAGDGSQATSTSAESWPPLPRFVVMPVPCPLPVAPARVPEAPSALATLPDPRPAITPHRLLMLKKTAGGMVAAGLLAALIYLGLTRIKVLRRRASYRRGELTRRLVFH